MGVPILQPVLGEGDVIPFEVLEDAGGSRIRIGDRTYARINAETFEGLRAGSLPLPDLSSESDGGGGGGGASAKTRFFGIEATGKESVSSVMAQVPCPIISEASGRVGFTGQGPFRNRVRRDVFLWNHDR